MTKIPGYPDIDLQEEKMAAYVPCTFERIISSLPNELMGEINPTSNKYQIINQAGKLDIRDQSLPTTN